MNPFRSYYFTVVLIFLLPSMSCDTNGKDTKPLETVKVEYPETYELANIILALTDYGMTDPWEVRKGFRYYDKLVEYFGPYMNHPLLDSVNYSRERWKEYLSFRTDSYAFVFDEDNKLKRTIDFYANEGIRPFDDHLKLVEDFVEKSNYRAFFVQNSSYYHDILEDYSKSQYLDEMMRFLNDEFGEQYSSFINYKVVLSTLVYRMNCHRDIDSTITADFVTIPNYLIRDTVPLDRKNIAIEIHNLFTEMNHGYVNPTTNKYRETVKEGFDAAIWDADSGYNESDGYDDTGNAVFNEYMTWAVYDIFINKFFPEFAEEVSLSWSFQNESRGFPYQQFFSAHLLKLYASKNPNETIGDLYPKLLDWTKKNQDNLTKPIILSPKDSIKTKFSAETNITLAFSEAMKKSTKITVTLEDEKGNQESMELNMENRNFRWSEDGTSLYLTIPLPNSATYRYLALNYWGTKNPVYSEKGILLKGGSYFKIVNQALKKG